MLKAVQPEDHTALAAIQDCLDQINSLEPKISMVSTPAPPTMVFDEAEREARIWLGRAENDMAWEQFNAIKAHAKVAFDARDAAAWSESYAMLVSLMRQIEPSSGEAPAPPYPTSLRLYLMRVAGELRQRARERPRRARVEGLSNSRNAGGDRSRGPWGVGRNVHVVFKDLPASQGRGRGGGRDRPPGSDRIPGLA